MRGNIDKTFILVGGTVLVLLLMHLLPPLSIGPVAFRRVSILSDISNSPYDRVQPDVIPRVETNGLLANDSVPEKWPDGVEPITDFAQGEGGGMNHFYAMLDTIATHHGIGRPVRIAYYGDSFIEGDLLVADLREMMQARYGGNGVGWIDAGNEMNQYRLSIRSQSKGLVEHIAMNRSDYAVAKTGLSERYYQIGSGATMYQHASNTYPHTFVWDVARLYLRAPDGLTINMNVDGGPHQTDRIAPSTHVQVYETRAKMNNIGHLLSGGSAVLFGLALESDHGVVIDNFGMRGTSGITLSSIPEETLKDFARLRPYDLIVFQYGVNAVSAKTTQEDLEWYMRYMKRVIAHFRKCYPEASLLIVSTPDHGARSPEGIGTMKGIEMLVGFQQQLAADNHVAFYNLFHAMGGRGAMGRLEQQGLCSKDYVHLNHDGGKVVARHIFNSLVAGHDNWVARHRKAREE